MKKFGTAALVILTAVTLSTFSLGCEKKKEPAPAKAPANTPAETPAGGN